MLLCQHNNIGRCRECDAEADERAMQERGAADYEYKLQNVLERQESTNEEPEDYYYDYRNGWPILMRG